MRRWRNTWGVAALAAAAATGGVARGEEYYLLTGLDAGKSPGTARNVSPSPGPGFPGSFLDGDRLAGTTDTGATIPLLAAGTPLFLPNEFGSLSFLFRRGSAPAGPTAKVPVLGVEFLGGPLLDLDGNLGNGSRSLVPVTGQAAVTIPGTRSLIDLSVNKGAGTIGVNRFDATGTNEGGASSGVELNAAALTTVNTLAGTANNGTPGAAINPGVDTRQGTLAAFTGVGGTLAGVSRVTNLGFEFWQDSIDSTSGTASTLGTFQQLGRLRGYVIERDAGTGLFPTLAGQGLGTTLWPLVDTSAVGSILNTANGLAGGTATISNGPAADQFSAAGNGGLAMAGFGGDLGAYLDAVVVPNIDPNSQSFVYLEAAGFGVNNSGDPVFLDTTGYDAVLIAQSAPVPEPGAAAALAVVGGALVARRRRRGEAR